MQWCQKNQNTFCSSFTTDLLNTEHFLSNERLYHQYCKEREINHLIGLNRTGSLSLLDSEGKLYYEHLTRIKLNDEIGRKRGLFDNQYRFSEGQQTVDAIFRVIEIVKEAVA